MKRKPIDLGQDELPNIPSNPDEEQQKKLAERFKVSQYARKYARPLAVIAELNGIPREDLSERQLNHLVESYAETGEYDRAYELSRNKEYKKIWDVVNGKTKKCKCKDWSSVELIKGQVTPVTYSRLFTRKEIFNVLTGKDEKLVMCNNCGNITI